jgi:single-strand DNA-binding protein
MNYHKLILAGNVTRDAESKTSNKGDVAFATFSVAVSGGKDRTTYFPVVVFEERLVKLAKSYVTKGRQVLVEGRIQVDEQRRFNVVADNIQLGARKGGAAQ